MLQVFRRHAYSWGTRALLGLLVLVFIIFFGGLGSYFLQAKPIASVGCHTLLGVMTLPGCYNIYPNQVDEEVTNLRKILINRYGDNAPRMMQSVNLRQMAVEQLIEQQLVTDEARRLGLVISDEDLAKAIESQAAFQVDGHFNVQQYDNVLRSNGV